MQQRRFHLFLDQGTLYNKNLCYEPHFLAPGRKYRSVIFIIAKVESTYTGNVSHEFFRIAKGTGYKSSELESLQEGNTLCIGGKEIEVKRNFMACN